MIIMLRVKKYLNEYNPEWCVDMYSDGETLIDKSMNYDSIILDIEIPRMNGMIIANLLREKGYAGEIIFLTSYDEYIEDAFKVRAYRFLHKPIVKEKLLEAVNSVNEEIYESKIVIVKQKGKDTLIKTKDIIFLEAYGDGTYIYTKDKILDSHETLKYWMNKLGNEKFYHVHKSYFVSFEYINTIEKEMVLMKHYNGEIPVARRRWKEFKIAYYDFIRKNR